MERANLWIEEVAPERLTEFFDHYHKALEILGNGTHGSWKEMTTPAKNRLVAAAHLILLEDLTGNKPAKHRPYFAEPGEAEWGC